MTTDVEATEAVMARCTAAGHGAATALASQKAKPNPHTELDELIDFMVVQSALKDNDEAEKVYVKTLGEKAQAQLMKRGGGSGSGKKWFGMG